MNLPATNMNKVALITGAAKRIGAAIARQLHSQGINIVLHYRHSKDHAQALCGELNVQRSNSATALQADLSDIGAINELASLAQQYWGRVDILINNASSFYSTEIGNSTDQQWQDLFNSNLKAPFFLSQALAPELKKNRGCIINMADIHAERPLKNHSIYCCAKAGNVMLTKSLARELAPEIRVNGVAPGAILWPEEALNVDEKNEIIERTALKRAGTESDIAATVWFLVNSAPYITGQLIPVDGGRTLSN
jgi:pteridine reductase